MQYQSIVDLIRQTAESVNLTGSFFHGDKISLTLENDAPMPHINFFEPTDNTPDSNNGVKTFQCLFLFATQEPTDCSPEQREPLIAAMDNLSSRFLNALNTNDLIEIKAVRREPQKNGYQARLTGYALSCIISGYLINDVCNA